MNWPCTSCGSKVEHSGEQCVARRPKCHACGKRPTCIQAIANGCRPTCIDCYFQRRVIARLFERDDLAYVQVRRHLAEGVVLWGHEPDAVAAAIGMVIGCSFRLAEMAADCRAS